MLSPHLETFLNHILRARSDHHFEFSWLNNIPHVAVIKAEMFLAESELHTLRFTRLECDTFEPLQLFHWTRHARSYIANVELNYFITGALAGVHNFDADCN